MMRLVDANMAHRIEKTVIIGTCWLIFAIFFLAFNPIALNFFQNVALFTASGFITVGAVSLTWINMLDCE